MKDDLKAEWEAIVADQEEVESLVRSKNRLVALLAVGWLGGLIVSFVSDSLIIWALVAILGAYIGIEEIRISGKSARLRIKYRAYRRKMAMPLFNEVSEALGHRYHIHLEDNGSITLSELKNKNNKIS